MYVCIRSCIHDFFPVWTALVGHDASDASCCSGLDMGKRVICKYTCHRAADFASLVDSAWRGLDHPSHPTPRPRRPVDTGIILVNRSICGDTGQPLLPRRRSLASSLSTGLVSVLDTTQGPEDSKVDWAIKSTAVTSAPLPAILCAEQELLVLTVWDAGDTGRDGMCIWTLLLPGDCRSSFHLHISSTLPNRTWQGPWTRAFAVVQQLSGLG